MAHTRLKMKNRRVNGPYYQVPHGVADTVAYRSLSVYAFKLWHDMLLEYNGKNNGQITAIFCQFADRGWAKKNGTFYRALDELQEKFLITKTRQGGIGAMKKICSYYSFTHLPTPANKENGLRQLPASGKYVKWKVV
jgi:hypothetical protein